MGTIGGCNPYWSCSRQGPIQTESSQSQTERESRHVADEGTQPSRRVDGVECYSGGGAVDVEREVVGKNRAKNRISATVPVMLKKEEKNSLSFSPPQKLFLL